MRWAGGSVGVWVWGRVRGRMEADRAAAIEMLNGIQLADSRGKVDGLGTLQELVCQKRPEVLGELLPGVLGLVGDSNSAVRRQVVIFVQAAVQREQRAIAQAYPALEHLVATDASGGVLRTTLQVLTHMLAPAFRLMVSSPDGALQAMFNGLGRGKDVVLGLVAQPRVKSGDAAASEAVRAAAVRYLASLAVLLTEPAPDGGGEAVPRHLEGFRPSQAAAGAGRRQGHPFLDPRTLNAEGGRLVESLLGVLKAGMASEDLGTTVACVEGLATVAAHRPMYIEAVGPALGVLASGAPPPVLDAVKAAFLRLVQVKGANMSAARANLVSVLRQLGAGEEAEVLATAAEPSQPGLTSGAGAHGVKREAGAPQTPEGGGRDAGDDTKRPRVKAEPGAVPPNAEGAQQHFEQPQHQQHQGAAGMMMDLGQGMETGQSAFEECMGRAVPQDVMMQLPQLLGVSVRSLPSFLELVATLGASNALCGPALGMVASMAPTPLLAEVVMAYAGAGVGAGGGPAPPANETQAQRWERKSKERMAKLAGGGAGEAAGGGEEEEEDGGGGEGGSTRRGFEELDEDAPQALLATLKEEEEAGKLAKTSRISGALAKCSAAKPPPIPVLELSVAKRVRMREMALERMVGAEGGCELAGWTGLRLRGRVMCRLVCRGGSEASRALLLDHVVGDFGRRFPLAVEWLHQEFAHEVGNATGGERYGRLVEDLMRCAWLRTEAGQEVLLRLVREFPEVPGSLLDLVQTEWCEAKVEGVGKGGGAGGPTLGSSMAPAQDGSAAPRIEGVEALGLTVLKAVMDGRPGLRRGLMARVLRYTAWPDEGLRGHAIRLAGSRLFDAAADPTSAAGQEALVVEGFATWTFETALLPVVGDGGMTEAEVAEARDGLKQYVNAQVERSDSVSGRSADTLAWYAECAAAVDDVLLEQPGAEGDALQGVVAIEQRISLYLALCARRQDLFVRLMEGYIRGGPLFRQILSKNVIGLVKRLGPGDAVLLSLFNACPAGGEPFLLHILRTLTEAGPPPPALTQTVHALYQAKRVDASFLPPIVAALSKKEVVAALPALLSMEGASTAFRSALVRMLGPGGADGGAPPVIAGHEVLVALHEIDAKRDGVSTKAVLDAVGAVFAQREKLSQDGLALALQKICEMPVLPVFTFRTILQAVNAQPKLSGFVTNLLQRLVAKKVWESDALWKGFLFTGQKVLPHSVPVFLSLPPPQLESALGMLPQIRPILRLAAEKREKGEGGRPLPRATFEILTRKVDAVATKGPDDPNDEGDAADMDAYAEGDQGPDEGE